MRQSYYHPISKGFHWVIVIMLAIQFAVGWIMPGIRRNMMPSGLVSFHVAFGITILGVVILRLLWRIIHRAPEPEPGMPWWQKLSAKAVHYLLYASVIALPVTGWWLASAHGWAVTVFGFVTLPPLGPANAAMEQLADFAHVATVTVAAILIGLHILAALYHYFILKDKTLQRMLPSASRR